MSEPAVLTILEADDALGQPGSLTHEQALAICFAWTKRVAADLRRGVPVQRILQPLPRAAIATMPERLGRPPACRRGCSMCCYQAVAVSPIEVLNLAGYLRATRSPDALSSLRITLYARLSGVAAAPRHPGSGKPLGYAAPCALLSPDGACTVYQHRPLSCVGYHSLDAAACADRGGLHPYVGPPLQTALAIRTGLSIGCEEAGLHGGPVELTAALAAALADPHLEDRWRRGEPVFAAAALGDDHWHEVRETVGKRLPVVGAAPAAACGGGR